MIKQAKFEAGKTYANTTFGDTPLEMTVVRRTEQTVVVNINGTKKKDQRLKIHTTDETEFVLPLGSYAQAPTIRAAKMTKAQEKKAASKAEPKKAVPSMADLKPDAKKAAIEKLTPKKKPTVTKKDGPVARVHAICEANWGSARKDVIALCVKAGINKFTARTQYQVFKKLKDTASKK